MGVLQSFLARAKGWPIGAVVAVLLFAPNWALADTRVALVIGNSAYQHAPALPNPPKDAAAVAAAFRKVGFSTVEVRSNLGKAQMEAALKQFAQSARGADVAVVYYAGHGMELGGVNYMVPVDATLATDGDVEFEAVPLALIERSVQGATRLKLVILDACRNNPFLNSMRRTAGTRAVGRGFARVEPEGDTLIAYAAREGSVASDGDAGNSPFTAALVRQMTTPGLEIRLMFGKVRDDVVRATGRTQEPAIYGSLGGDPFYFVPASYAASPGATLPTTPQTAVQAAQARLEPTVEAAVTAADLAANQARAKAAEAMLADSRAQQTAVRARDAAARAEAGEAGYGVLTGGDKADAWRYAGQVANGKADGVGVWRYGNGVRAEGSFTAGQRNSPIVIVYSDETFGGDFGGTQRILGVNREKDGSTYAGEYRDGKANGLGVYRTGSNPASEFAGQMADGDLSGYGVMMRDGAIEKGAFAGSELTMGAKFGADARLAAQGAFSGGYRVGSGYTGMTIQNFTAEMAEAVGVKGLGAIVAAVLPGGPAASAGLMAGDVVTAVNGVAVDSSAAMTEKISAARVGDSLRLSVLRQGATQVIEVRAGARPTQEQLAAQDSSRGVVPARLPAASASAMGLSLSILDPATRASLKLAEGAGGAVVYGVDNRADAATKGLTRGDVIVSVNGASVARPADVEAAVAAARSAGRRSVLAGVYRNGRVAFLTITP